MRDVISHRWSGRWRVVLWGGAAMLFLLPLLAMQFTREVTWTGFDFEAFGLMLAVACGAFELAVRLLRKPLWRVGAGVAILVVFLLVWAQGAVGLFDRLPIA